MSSSIILLNKLLQCSQIRQVGARGFKSDLKIKWVRPEKIPCFKPQKSGDLKPLPSIDQNQYSVEFRNSKELETADDVVKRLFTLQFQPRRKTVELYIRQMTDSVRRHAYDRGSIEAKLARWTGAIRALQEQMEIHTTNRRLKVNLKELIDRRKKHLKYLRRWDYKKFEWLIEALDIEYKPPPNEFHWITRKDSLRKLTDQYCEGIRNERLDEYKKLLQEAQPAFLEEKIRTLQFLRDEQEDCGVEVTIKDEEIAQAKEQLNKLLQEKSLREKDAE